MKGESTVGRGVVGVATTGNGVVGRARTGNGVVGHSIAGTGVVGTSSEGVGGRFSGREAPMNLVPANFLTHPGGGNTGDFYVDSSGRLWFCKQGSEGVAAWKQLATLLPALAPRRRGAGTLQAFSERFDDSSLPLRCGMGGSVLTGERTRVPS